MLCSFQGFIFCPKTSMFLHFLYDADAFCLQVVMEALTERLERAVTRLEQLTTSTSLSNGDCVNGINGGKTVLDIVILNVGYKSSLWW